MVRELHRKANSFKRRNKEQLLNIIENLGHHTSGGPKVKRNKIKIGKFDKRI